MCLSIKCLLNCLVDVDDGENDPSSFKAVSLVSMIDETYGRRQTVNFLLQCTNVELRTKHKEKYELPLERTFILSVTPTLIQLRIKQRNGEKMA